MFWGFKYITIKVLLAMFTIIFGISLIKLLAWMGVILLVTGLVFAVQAVRGIGRILP